MTMPPLSGVRIGPLDADGAESFGQVGGQTTARRLIRHHVAMHPPALVGALSRVRQDARSEALDREEAEEYIRDWYEEQGEPLPDEAKITGFAVRGDDDSPEQQVVTFTFTTKGGRTAKGAVPYRELSSSIEAGDEALYIEKMKAAGLPWQARATAQIETRADQRKLDETDELRRQLEELQEQVRRIEEQRPSVAASAGGGSGVSASPQAPEGGSTLVGGSTGPATVERDNGADEGEPGAEHDTGDSEGDGEPDNGGEPDGGSEPEPVEEPWEGYEGTQAQVVRQRVRDADDADLAQRVLRWELRPGSGPRRSTVIAAANEVLDRKSPGSG